MMTLFCFLTWLIFKIIDFFETIPSIFVRTLIFTEFRFTFLMVDFIIIWVYNINDIFILILFVNFGFFSLSSFQITNFNIHNDGMVYYFIFFLPCVFLRYFFIHFDIFTSLDLNRFLMHDRTAICITLQNIGHVKLFRQIPFIHQWFSSLVNHTHSDDRRIVPYILSLYFAQFSDCWA